MRGSGWVIELDDGTCITKGDAFHTDATLRKYGEEPNGLRAFACSDDGALVGSVFVPWRRVRTVQTWGTRTGP